MRVRTMNQRVFLAAAAAVATALAGIGNPAIAGTVQLGATPPNLTTSVPPNIVFTFDDSGSMQSSRVNDDPPWTTNNNGNLLYSSMDWGDGSNNTSTTGSGGGPWRCANVIDADNLVPGVDLRSQPMNGVYYNPNIKYNPPLYASGNTFPNADATLNAVWVDGIAVNRPMSPVTVDNTARYNNNPDLDRAYNSSGSNVNFPGAISKLNGTKTSTTDNRWKCGTGVAISGGGGDLWNGASPMDGASHTLSDGTAVTYPNGGPYYYRLKATVTVAVDKFGIPTNLGCGTANCDGLHTLYNTSNWEAVPVPAGQYQNFANWYAYYRTRNQMARTAMSRVFGDPGLVGTTASGGYGGNQRVAWQNLNSANYQLPSNAIISELIDTSACTSSATANPVTIQQSGAITTPPNCYRSAFYNWIFQVPAGGGTPTRSTVNRAGIFFTRGNGNTGATGNLTDPYWQPPISGTGSGNELYCRQNYHMLVTDGLWNGGTNGPSYSSLTLPASGLTLPDGVAFPDPTTSGVTSIYNPVHDGGDAGYASLSDIAFNFWAKDLRSDLYKPTANPPQIVAPYMPDQSTGVFNLTGNVGSTVPQTNVNPEIYFNPFNDSATWPHMDEFLVGLGVNGQLNISQNTDCTNTTSGAKQDACLLRKGQTNSSGSVGWPTPNGQGGGIAANVDDTWHAGLAGRGEFFSAGDPQALIKALVRFLANINARAGTSVALTTSISVATASTAGFSGGYNSDWSGNLPEYAINPTTGQSIPPAVLDAGCILTGTGTGSTMPSCTTTATINTSQQPTPYTSRNVYTYVSASTPTQAFSKTTFSSLNAADQCALNNGTWTASTSTCTGGDGYGPQRVDWLDGNRTYETATSPPQFRSRSSLLGAIIDAQPQYVGSPGGNYSDSWPSGSPEMASGAQLYSAFVKAVNGRPPIVYAAANDGMLHAFSAGGVTVSSSGTVSVTPGGGVEQWAYVPQTVIQNGAVTAYANSTGGLVPTVDGNFSTQDVFFTSDNQWHTILVGTLRLGGRGAFALDITNGTSPTVLWDISNNSPNMADLGYTYGKPDIVRLNYSGGKWVVLLPSGYMPTGSPSTDPATTNESMFVLDAQTGAFIAELKTSAIDSSAYGLTTPTVWGGSNNVGMIAAAGDLMGNLWRFDLSDPNAGNWKIDKMFQTPVPSGSSRTSPTQQPITVEPNAFSDPNNGGNPIWIFGTGKYLASTDNVSTSAPTQAFYGIRDYGTGSSKYPISAGSLVVQTLSESNGIRALTQCGVTGCSSGGASTIAPGWTFNMVDSGERDVVTGTPLYSAGEVLLTTLIPSNNNPCQPGLSGAVMLVDAVTGGAPSGTPPVNGGGYTPPSGSGIVGSIVANPPIAGNGTPVITPLGGGVVLIPGMPGFTISDSFWHRRSWRELLNQL
ncbi:MAG: pilus assembly protein [Sulfuricaulis sp.]